jgi:hypothetical protein
MSVIEELSIRQRIGTFYSNNRQLKKSFIVNHFKLEDIPKSTIYDIIKRVDNGISLERLSGSGNPKKISQKIKDKIIYENVNEIGRSYRSIGRNHDIHHMTAKKILNKAGVIIKKRKRAPKISEN